MKNILKIFNVNLFIAKYFKFFFKNNLENFIKIKENKNIQTMGHEQDTISDKRINDVIPRCFTNKVRK